MTAPPIVASCPCVLRDHIGRLSIRLAFGGRLELSYFLCPDCGKVFAYREPAPAVDSEGVGNE